VLKICYNFELYCLWYDKSSAEIEIKLNLKLIRNNITLGKGVLKFKSNIFTLIPNCGICCLAQSLYFYL
jgi:hypothetical protein